ncbi:MAG: T9SS type B sorting domain-containing protein [Pricia sp.]
MLKKLLYLAVLLASLSSFAQFACPRLNGPENGDVGVPVDALISWNSVEGAPGYLVSVGTSPGADDILSQRNVGVATSIQPPLGLPEQTDIYVTVELFFFDRDNIECSSELFTTEDVTTMPDCTEPVYPANGQTDVAVGTGISWNYAPTATGYNLTISTTPGAGDLLVDENIVASTRYQPVTDLPVNEEIFVRIVPYNENGTATGPCTEYSFTTSDLQPLPGCTQLSSPANGAINVPLTPFLEWPEVPDADGYIVSVGSSPFQNDVLDQATFARNSTFVIDFEPNRTFFATIVPFNDAGEAFGCSQTTFSTILGCGPFLDTTTGEFVSLNPEIDFPDTVSFCENEAPYSVAANDEADGYRWFKIGIDGTETLLSETAEVALTEEGMYRYEAYNVASQSGNTVECASSKDFVVVPSEIATITGLDISGQANGIRITVQVDGSGDYEYALDDSEGPYQDANIFDGVPVGSYTVFVRDKNGCGTVQENIEPDLTLEGFPKFFTPNGDGVNDLWQFVAPEGNADIELEIIYVFDRFGALLAQIDSRSPGWDGTFNGKSLPESDYWFKAEDGNQEISGHFTLKR